MIQDEAAEADDLATMVNHLALRAGDPERFHVEQDEIARRLRKMAKRLRGDNRKPTTTTWRSDDRQTRRGQG